MGFCRAVEAAIDVPAGGGEVVLVALVMVGGKGDWITFREGLEKVGFEGVEVGVWSGSVGVGDDGRKIRRGRLRRGLDGAGRRSEVTLWWVWRSSVWKCKLRREFRMGKKK